MSERERLQGVMAVLVTPLTEDESVDEGAWRKLIRRVIDGGCHAVVALGTAGEFATLRDDVKRRVLSIAVDEVGGQVPLIAGTGEPGTRRAVARTQEAADLGADAAMVVPPYYYPCDQSAVLAHYRTIAAEGGLPIILYNIPQFTKVPLEVGTVATLAQEPNIAGIKDSSGNLGGFQQMVAAAKSDTFSVITGSDQLLFASLVVGGDGCIGTGTNLAPHWFVQLWEAAHAGRWDEARELQTRIVGLHAGIAYGDFPAGMKAALELMGIGNGLVAAPRRSASPAESERIAEALRGMDLLA
jgi:4-hydroxy-tetrahydrodipicolinate synthase